MTEWAIEADGLRRTYRSRTGWLRPRRQEVEAVRGVQCGEILRLLMEKGLVRMAGRHDSLGRPVLYGTTKKFLQVFGLKNLGDLPQVEQLRPPDKRPSEGEGERDSTVTEA